MSKLKDVICSIQLQFIEMMRNLKAALDRANDQNVNLSKPLEKGEVEEVSLPEGDKAYRRLRIRL